MGGQHLWARCLLAPFPANSAEQIRGQGWGRAGLGASHPPSTNPQGNGPESERPFGASALTGLPILFGSVQATHTCPTEEDPRSER